MDVDVTVLHFVGLPELADRARAGERGCRAGRDSGTGDHSDRETIEDAERFKFTGSPTILIGGRDPFPRPGMAPALACRLYSTPEGLAGSPTVDQLVHALGATSLVVRRWSGRRPGRLWATWQLQGRSMSGRVNRTAGAAATRSTSRT